MSTVDVYTVYTDSLAFLIWTIQFVHTHNINKLMIKMSNVIESPVDYVRKLSFVFICK